MTGIFAALLEGRASLGQSFHVSQEPPGWVDDTYGWENDAGVLINQRNALEINAVYACTRVLAESVASLPLILYRRIGDRNKARAMDHSLYSLLHDLPNPEITSFEMRETLMGHLCTWGNAYAEIEWSAGGEVLALWPLRPDRIEAIERVNGEIYYTYRLPDKLGTPPKILHTSRVMHVRGMGFDGQIGYSPIRMQRNTLGLARATEGFGARFFQNDARPGGILEHPAKLSDEAHKRLRDSWEKRHQGMERSHRLSILEEGMKYHEIGLPPEDAQFLETRKFQTNEIARMYRMPPHMIQDLDRATFNNIEHLSISFVVNTLRPWLVRWEQAIARDLLLPSERDALFAEHLVSGLLRGDIQSRYEAYAQGRQNGWLSANDIRSMENMNPIEGGDTYLVPLNMVPADSVHALAPSPGMESDDDRARARRIQQRTPEARSLRSANVRRRLQQAHFSMYQDVAARVLRREANDVGNQARKQLTRRSLFEFNDWLNRFYQEHQQFVIDQFAPLANTYGELVAAEARDEVGEPAEISEGLRDWIRMYLEAFAARHSSVSEGRIRRAIRDAQEDGRDELEAVEQLLEGWPEQRATEVARWESVRFNNGLSVATYLGAGIQRLRWVAFGESCPYCSDLNGSIVGIRQFYLAAGEDYEPDGADRPLHVTHNVGHAPAHRGCDCMTVSA
jgi:HK97 family phage portal protein